MPLLFAYGINRFSHDMDHIVEEESSKAENVKHRLKNQIIPDTVMFG